MLNKNYETEIVIVLNKINNIAQHIFSLSLPLSALLRCLHRSFNCHPVGLIDVNFVFFLSRRSKSFWEGLV